MTILFLHGWHSTPGGMKPTYLKSHGHDLLNPALPDKDFDGPVRIAQADFDGGKPDVVVGSSRGGAVAMNIVSGTTPLALVCPAWKRWGTATTVKNGTVVLHSRADDVVPFADSEELVRNSGLPSGSLTEVGTEHRLADPESLRSLVRAVELTVPTLCLGIDVTWWGGSLNHAWCERGEEVIDLAMPVGMRDFKRAEYYRVLEPDVTRRYPAKHAILLFLRNRHYGPWEESEQLPEWLLAELEKDGYGSS